MEKIIHQIWLGDNELPERERNFILNMKLVNPSFEHRLWYDGNLPELEGELGKVYKHFRDAECWAFAADVMRLFLVYEYGGLYVDVDFEPLRYIEDWCLESRCGLFYHGDEEDYTISNGLFGLQKGHPLAKHIIDSVNTNNLRGYFPKWLGRTIKNYYNLDYEVPLSLLKNVMALENIYFPYVRELEGYMLHHGLYSWDWNKKQLFSKRQTYNPFIYN